MQVCKKTVLLILLGLCGTLFAQTIEMPQMPEMPQTSFPTLDDSFYTPTIPTSPVHKAKEPAKPEAPSATETASETKQKSADLFSLLTGSQSDILSASDISTLYDSGLFNNISSLSGINTNSSVASTNLLLQQILTSLDELKKEQKNASADQQEIYEDKIADSKNFATRGPSILRFKIDNYDIKDSLKTVFFSECESDGSFIFTADRRYFANQRYNNETFYLLFKAKKSNGASTTFDVIPSVAQDRENKNSYIYKLAAQTNLTAEKVGNLVVLHSADDGFNVDLLFDIDN